MKKQTTTATATATGMLATRAFKDSGTGASYAQGEKVEAEDGVLANYLAAGLVAAAEPTEPAPDVA